MYENCYVISGVCFYRITAEENTESRKTLLLNEQTMHGLAIRWLVKRESPDGACIAGLLIGLSYTR